MKQLFGISLLFLFFSCGKEGNKDASMFTVPRKFTSDTLQVGQWSNYVVKSGNNNYTQIPLTGNLLAGKEAINQELLADWRVPFNLMYVDFIDSTDVQLTFTDFGTVSFDTILPYSIANNIVHVGAVAPDVSLYFEYDPQIDKIKLCYQDFFYSYFDIAAQSTDYAPFDISLAEYPINTDSIIKDIIAKFALQPSDTIGLSYPKQIFK